MPATGAPIPTPTSKQAVKVPIATPRRCGATRSITSRTRLGNISENAAPTAIAPASAVSMFPASAIRTRPSASITPAPIAQRTPPKRSGIQPSRIRAATTVSAKAVKMVAP